MDDAKEGKLTREEFVESMSKLLILAINKDVMFVMFFLTGLQCAGIERTPESVSIVMKDILEAASDEFIKAGMSLAANG